MAQNPPEIQYRISEEDIHELHRLMSIGILLAGNIVQNLKHNESAYDSYKRGELVVEKFDKALGIINAIFSKYKYNWTLLKM